MICKISNGIFIVACLFWQNADCKHLLYTNYFTVMLIILVSIYRSWLFSIALYIFLFIRKHRPALRDQDDSLIQLQILESFYRSWLFSIAQYLLFMRKHHSVLCGHDVSLIQLQILVSIYRSWLFSIAQYVFLFMIIHHSDYVVITTLWFSLFKRWSLLICSIILKMLYG